jgi:hypothetical protein
MAAEKIKAQTITKPTKPRSRKTELIIKTATEHPDLTTREIGAIADCTHVNVIETLRRYHVNQQHLKTYKSNRADIIAGMQSRLLASVTDADIKKAPLGSRIMAAGILYDKERLERGQSTANVSVHSQLIESIPVSKSPTKCNMSAKAALELDEQVIDITSNDDKV